MTFPTIPDETIEAATQTIAGPGASRAALFTAGQQVKHVIKALQQVTPAEATREEWRTTPEGARTNIPHDHAMCDPDRNCGPGVSYDAAAKLEREAGGDKSGTWDSKTAAQREFIARVDAEHADAVAMERLNAAAVMNEKQRIFPGGRMWAENQGHEITAGRTYRFEGNDHEGLVRILEDVTVGAPYFEPNTPLEDHPVPEDDCCVEAPAEGPGRYPYTDPEDKLRIIADIVTQQAPLGTDLANFKRRLRLILDMQ